MQEFQKRVVAEKEELDGRIQRLELFMSGTIYVTLHANEQYRMQRQLKAMREYSEVLAERIAAFQQ